MLIAGTATNLLGASMVAFCFSYAWLVVSRIISGLGSAMFTTVQAAKANRTYIASSAMPLREIRTRRSP